MLNVLNNFKPIKNKKFIDYCNTSRDESIKKMVQRMIEREKLQKIGLNNELISGNNNSNTLQIFSLNLCLLSISSFIYYFLNKKYQ